MMKLLLTAIVFFSAFSLSAQGTPVPDSLDAYIGKYKFPEGSAVAELDMVKENGTLYGNSERGKSEFKKTTTADVFEIIEFSAVATFKRNTEGKVIGVRIDVGQLVLEGTKVETTNSTLSLLRSPQIRPY